MAREILTFLLIFIFSKVISSDDSNTGFSRIFSCSELEDVTLEKFNTLKQSGVFDNWVKAPAVTVTNYLSTTKSKNPMNINVDDWSALHECVFDVNKKTVVIIHGLLSSAKEDWVIDMKDALLEYVRAHIIN